MRKRISAFIIRCFVVSILLVFLVFLAGCLNYKSYDLPKEEVRDADQLVNEIARIENEINLDANKPEAEQDAAGQEVVLPKLSKEPAPDVPDNDLPIINVKENEFIRLKASIVDADKDPVSYSYSRPLNEKGEWKTNYGDAGEYLVTLSATDGKLTTTKRIKLLVGRVNVPPVIEGVRDITVREGEAVSFTPKITDPNNDKVTVTVSEPLKSGTFATDHSSAGEYQVTVVASDGELQTEKNFKLTVLDVNVLPVINNVENVNVKEGETVVIKPEVADADNDKLSVTISEPVGDDGVWETSFTDHGEYIATITVSDGKDTVTKKIRIIVEDVNVPPEIVEVTLETR